MEERYRIYPFVFLINFLEHEEKNGMSMKGFCHDLTSMIGPAQPRVPEIAPPGKPLGMSPAPAPPCNLDMPGEQIFSISLSLRSNSSFSGSSHRRE